MKRRDMIKSLFGTVICIILIIAAIPSVYAAKEQAAVSKGLYVIAAQNDMAKAALVGNDISFSSEDFARAMNLSKVDSITVTKIPPVTDGELRLGNTVITGGERLRKDQIAMLTYVSNNEDITKSSFDFRVNDSPVDVTCKLYLLDKINSCPTLSGVTENYLNVSTHENITMYGTLPCYDPDGDQVRIEITRYPDTGALILTDSAKGEYLYIPNEGFSGKDQFSYVARDTYGNYSASKTVSLTVNKRKSSVAYVDMKDCPAYNAALTMTDEGIMSGTQVGNEIYFYPNTQVSREEFVVMAMNALGMREVTSPSGRVFSDDADISEAMRDHISVAYELGYIKGETNEKGQLCFYPKRTITRAEAACILCNMIDAATPTFTPSFSDSNNIPTWAAPSIYSLNYMGIMVPTGGNIAPLDPLTRGDTAMILSSVMALD